MVWIGTFEENLERVTIGPRSSITASCSGQPIGCVQGGVQGDAGSERTPSFWEGHLSTDEVGRTDCPGVRSAD
jgi:hypothetical protein